MELRVAATFLGAEFAMPVMFVGADSTAFESGAALRVFTRIAQHE
jgi:hypothetical protein